MLRGEVGERRVVGEEGSPQSFEGGGEPACLRGAAFDLAAAAAIAAASMSRIKRPMYCICRRLASWLFDALRLEHGLQQMSASAIDFNCVSGLDQRHASACSSCISRFLRVLLTISSCTRCS